MAEKNASRRLGSPLPPARTARSAATSPTHSFYNRDAAADATTRRVLSTLPRQPPPAYVRRVYDTIVMIAEQEIRAPPPQPV